MGKSYGDQSHPDQVPAETGEQKLIAAVLTEQRRQERSLNLYRIMGYTWGAGSLYFFASMTARIISGDPSDAYRFNSIVALAMLVLSFQAFNQYTLLRRLE